MAATPAFPAAPFEGGAIIDNADGTAYQDVFTAPDTGCKIGNLRACSDDAAEVVLSFARTIGGVDHRIGEVNVPAGSGTNGSATFVDLLEFLNGGVAMNFKAGSKLRVSAKTAVAPGRQIEITAEGGEY